MENHPKVAIIIGGGITGLATAYFLEEAAKQQNLPPVTSILIEKENRWGGKLLTETYEGYVIEAGPDAMLAQKPSGINLCMRLGLADELMETNQYYRSTYIWFNGKFHKLPSGFTGFFPASPLDLFKASFLSFSGKLRMAMEPLTPAKAWKEDVSDDESMAGFLRRRFGREAFNKFLEPLMAGIFAGDAEKLSIRSTFPMFVELEKQFGSIFAGLKKRRIKTKKRLSSPFVTLKSGLGKLTNSIIASVRNVILMPNSTVTSLNGCAGGGGNKGRYAVRLADGKEIYGDVVVLAVPSYEASCILKDFDSKIPEQLKTIHYTSTATVSLAFRKKNILHPMNGTGYVIPGFENSPIMAVTWTSCKWEYRAPEHAALLRCYLGRTGKEEFLEKNDSELINLCLDELKKSMKIYKRPILERVHRWHKAMPQYLVGHLGRLDLLEKRMEAFPGLYLAGSSYYGVGIPDCITSGETTASKIVSYLSKL